MIKKIKYFFVSIFFFVLVFLFIDLTNFDTKYINRSAINIDIKNLDSKYSKKIFNYLRLIYLKNFELINKTSYKKRWGVEDVKQRNTLPNEILLPKKIDNFAKAIYDIDEYDTLDNWHRSHGGNFSTRFSGHDLINVLNADNMKLVWKYEPKIDNNYVDNIQANPIFFDGLIITPNTQNQVVAIDPVNGEEIWSYNVIDGLAAKRGLVLYSPKNNNSLSKENLNPRVFFTNNRDKLFALNAYTGEPIKKFGNKGSIEIGTTPIPPVIYKDQLILIDTQSQMVSVNLFTGKINWKYKVNIHKNSLLFANFLKGSPWGGFALDHKRGLMFFTTGNAEDWHVGIDRPGDNLYGNSVVAFDLDNQKIKWYFQAIPHDLWNMDLAAPPVLTVIKKNNINIDVVVVVSKLGNTFVLDRETGESLYDLKKIRSPVSNVPGERTSKYQLSVDLPKPVCRNKININELNNLSYVDNKRLREIYSKSETGFPNPPKIGKMNMQIAGCVRWAGASIDTENNILYVSTDQKPYRVSIIKNSKKKMNGKNLLPGKYTHYWEYFHDKKMYPAIKPPWGSIVALDLNSGEVLWKVPFGEYKDLTKLNIPKTGTFNRAGITASKGGLIFASGTHDNFFTVFNSKTGTELWHYQMSHPGSAPPLIFSYLGKQYIIVPAFEKGGKKIYAYSLK